MSAPAFDVRRTGTRRALAGAVVATIVVVGSVACDRRAGLGDAAGGGAGMGDAASSGVGATAGARSTPARAATPPLPPVPRAAGSAGDGVFEPHFGRSAAEVDALFAQWPVFAVNALLEPLLATGEPPRWAAPHALMPCDGSGAASIEGAPPRAGERLPDGPFVLRWSLADCMPLGVTWLSLRGAVALHVRVEAERLIVRVEPSELVAVVDGRRRPLAASFETNLRLGSQRE